MKVQPLREEKALDAPYQRYQRDLRPPAVSPRANPKPRSHAMRTTAATIHNTWATSPTAPGQQQHEQDDPNEGSLQRQ